MSTFSFGWIPQIYQELRRYFASKAQGDLASTALQPAAIGVSVQAYDVDLVGLGGLSTTGTVERTGAGTFATYTVSTYAKTLLDDASAAAARTTLGLTIGTDVQAYDADLDAISALTGTGVYRRTGNGTAALISQWVDNSICQGRMSLLPNAPVTTIDVIGATTLYFAPFNGNTVALYDGTEWALFPFAERSLALSGTTANTIYDVFIFNNAGTLTLELTAWASDTARTTALTLQDGVWVRAGSLTRRYLGTIRTVAAGQGEDSAVRGFCWNLYNARPRVLRRGSTNTSSYSYGSGTPRLLAGDANFKVDFVTGIALDPISGFIGGIANSGDQVLGFGLNSTTLVVDGNGVSSQALLDDISNFANLRRYPPRIGLNTINLLEVCPNGNTYNAIPQNFTLSVEIIS